MIVEAAGLRWEVDTAIRCGDLIGPGHEEAVEGKILALLPSGGVFLDVGAHVGHYTLRGARIASRVIAVEADPGTAARLLANLDLNAFTGVTVHNVAAWDCRASLTLHSPNGQVRDASMRVLPDREGVRVPALPLDDLLGGEPRIDLVKLDVEGADLHALRGMSATLSRLRPVMVIEDHSVLGYFQRRDLEELLASLGYEWEQLGFYGGAPYLLARPLPPAEEK